MDETCAKHAIYKKTPGKRAKHEIRYAMGNNKAPKH